MKTRQQSEFPGSALVSSAVFGVPSNTSSPAIEGKGGAGRPARRPGRSRCRIANRGSVLIIVMWVAFGLVAITLYFAHAMLMDLKAADNEVSSVEADQEIEGAMLYVSNVLATRSNVLCIPSAANFRANAAKIGNGKFWLIGRDTNDLQSSGQAAEPFWGLVDEASKVNLNYTNPTNFQNLPNMTINTAAATGDWASNSTMPSQNGAKSETYSALATPYLCKSAPFETPEEMRLVFGMTLDALYGEDVNQNGILDPNENDGTTLPPYDNQDGILDPGALEYVTVWSHESTLGSNGITRVSVTNTTALQQLFQTNFPSMTQYLQPFGIGTTGGGGGSGRGGGGGGSSGTVTAAAAPTSVLDFYIRSGMPVNDFVEVEPYLVNPALTGMINVNTATATALACIPGIGSNYAPEILSYRQSNPPQTPTISWLVQALNNTGALEQAGPYVTAYSFQYAADIVAVGHNNRGFRRVRFVFDCSSGTPLVVYRQDLTYLGWPLGKKLHDQLMAGTLK